MPESDPVPTTRPTLCRLLPALGVAAGLALLPAPARAWFVGGIGFGVPIFVGPPPPPVYFAPPYPYPPPYAVAPPYGAGYPPEGAPVAAQSPLGQAGGATQSVPGMACSTGAYVCPLPSAGRVGARCSCPAESGGRAYGTIR